MVPVSHKYPNVVFFGEFLEFQDFGFNHSTQRVIAWKEAHPECAPFTVLHNGEISSVWLNISHVGQCLQVSPILLIQASQTDKLLFVLFLHAVCNHLFIHQTPLTSEQKEEFLCMTRALDEHQSSYYSAKFYGLPGSIYLRRNFIAGGLKKSQFNRGSYAVVKKAINLDLQLIVRRICIIANDFDMFRFNNWIKATTQNSGNSGIIQILGSCCYKAPILGPYWQSATILQKIDAMQKVSPDNTAYRKIAVMFLPFYPQDLLEFFINDPHPRGSPLAQHYALQLTETLAALKGAHRDIKPDNILVNPQTREMVITDFDFYWSQERLWLTCGSPAWSAPESLQSTRSAACRKETIDVWPLAQILYWLLTDGPLFPWHHRNFSSALTEQHAKEARDMVHQSNASPRLQTLLCSMLVFDPNQRATIAQVADTMRMQWPFFDLALEIEEKIDEVEVVENPLKRSHSDASISPILDDVPIQNPSQNRKKKITCVIF